MELNLLSGFFFFFPKRFCGTDEAAPAIKTMGVFNDFSIQVDISDYILIIQVVEKQEE